jgi:23S rRNA pseudouridine2605 synthase
VLAPEAHLDKTYHVQIAAIADAALLASIAAGVRTGDGVFLRAKSARILRSGDKNSWLEIVLEEGKNRHIRRMLAQLSIEVLRLLRVAIGPLRLGDLPKGSSRPLTDVEKCDLDCALRQQAAVRNRAGAALQKA